MSGKQRNEEQDRFRNFSRRAALLGGGKMLLLGALAGRMYYLQIVESDRFTLLAEDNRINLRLLAPPRGRILDRFGVPVADNRQNYRLLLVKEEAQDIEAALDLVHKIVPLSEEERAKVIKDSKRYRSFVPITVKDNLTWDQVSRIEVNAPDLPGVSIDVGQTRAYPYGATLAHILGYVAAVSEQDLNGDPLLELPDFRIGKNGVERLHDEVLRGKAGSSQVEVNAYGRVIQELDREEGQSGQDVVLTVDVGLQNYTYQRLMGERSAAAVVMDVNSGDVLAMASVPGFDPTPFNVGMSSKEWSALIGDPLGPLNNKAVTGMYAPGSTFKMIVALAALEAGISPQETEWCSGYTQLGNHRFHCWKRHGHGHMNMNAAIQQSCDIYFYEVAQRIGVDRIAEVAQRFGLGEATGIDLPHEKDGLIPTKAWKLATLGEPWQGGETLIAAIGQGYVLTTPLQLAVMTARLVNGGRAIQPRVVRGIKGGEREDKLFTSHGEEMQVDPAHLAIVMKAMNDVVNSQRGTARRSAIREEGWEMGGKTGTSQVRRITKAEREAGVVRNEDLPWRRRDHALFVGYAPVEQPRYACAVIVEHGGGGSKAAAPIARDLLLEVQRRDPLGNEALPLLAQANQTPEG